MKDVSVIMYHYVRDIHKSRFPEIKGLEATGFANQLTYLTKNYNLVRVEDVIDAVHGKGELPQNAALLTFDDAYLDHYNYVLPILHKFGVQGTFFIPAQMIVERKILDVNKIHFILAATADKKYFINRIVKQLNHLRKTIPLSSPEEYYAMYGQKNRFDTADVVFIKRMLQKVIPQPFRSQFVHELFLEAVNMDEESFSNELYLKKEQIQHMSALGMHIGNHTYSHPWLNSLSKAEQKEEISACNRFLDSLGVLSRDWTMCFPYGGYNQETLEVLEEMNCKLAFTIEARKASLLNSNFLEIPRFDTNDFPQ